MILESVRKTGRLIVADTGWKSGGGAEIVTRVAEQALGDLKSPPLRIALPERPTPTTSALANKYYPRAVDIVATARHMLGLSTDDPALHAPPSTPLDVPDASFTGPF